MGIIIIEGKVGLKDIHCIAQIPRYLLIYYKTSFVKPFALQIFFLSKSITYSFLLGSGFIFIIKERKLLKDLLLNDGIFFWFNAKHTFFYLVFLFFQTKIWAPARKIEIQVKKYIYYNIVL